MQISLQTIPMLAYTDLSSYQYRFVKVTSADFTVTFCNASTDIAIGVLQNKPDTAGQSASVMVYGVTKLVAAGTITRGTRVGPTTGGDAIAVTGDDIPFAGIALQSAVDDDVFACLLTPGGSLSESGDD